MLFIPYIVSPALITILNKTLDICRQFRLVEVIYYYSIYYILPRMAYEY
jgi:hypothetical protein